MNEVVTSEDELKLRTEASILKPKDGENGDHDGRGRKSLSERFKSKFMGSGEK
jgi:hypothetical protein